LILGLAGAILYAARRDSCPFQPSVTSLSPLTQFVGALWCSFRFISSPARFRRKFILRSYYQSAVNNARDEFLGHPIAFSIEGSALMAYFMGFGWRRFSLLETAPEEEKE
jgi:hypothetical protein